MIVLVLSLVSLHACVSSALLNANLKKHVSSLVCSTKGGNNNIMNNFNTILSSQTERNNDPSKKQKKLILIRHGRTYMNEYLSQKGCQWGDPDFTDIFPIEDTRDEYYLDTPLSEHGRNQAMRLCKQCMSQEEILSTIHELELIVVSPLTRALQTFEIGLYPVLTQKQSQKDRRKEQREPRMVALPLAAERLYLISDIGKSTSLLKESYPYIDFETGFDGINHNEWWFTPDEKIDGKYYYKIPSSDEFDENNVVDYPQQTAIYQTYKEWRPCNERQKYAIDCGEPQDVFDSRMQKLLNWIEERDEEYIALVCHWGVLHWLTDGEDFDNCELKIVEFDELVGKKNLIHATS